MFCFLFFFNEEEDEKGVCRSKLLHLPTGCPPSLFAQLLRYSLLLHLYQTQ